MIAAEKENDNQPKTWKEFRDLVEKQMTEKGISENIELWYIDLTFPCDVDIYLSESGMAI